MTQPLWRRALAECIGTGLLVAIVVGSGIMAQQLSSDVGLQLLENSIATTLGLAILILMFQQVSGAQFNPVVTLADRALAAFDRQSGSADRVGTIVTVIVAQCLGGIGGAVLANLMFEVPTVWSTTDRNTPAHFLAEVVATAGLLLIIFSLVRSGRSAIVGPAVGAYIGAAYWFTSSTSFANPAVTIGRMFTDTFAGIAPASAPAYIGAQLIGAALGVVLILALFPATTSVTAPSSPEPSPTRKATA